MQRYSGKKTNAEREVAGVTVKRDGVERGNDMLHLRVDGKSPPEGTKEKNDASMGEGATWIGNTALSWKQVGAGYETNGNGRNC